MTTLRRRPSVIMALALLSLLLPTAAAPAAAESTLSVPSGFRDRVVWSGLSQPTVVTFAPNGQVFVAEKGGRILAFDSLADTSATVVADLSPDVQNYWDRGLLGLAVDPGYPARPFLYALYSYDHILDDGTPAPRWGDRCPSIASGGPGANTDGCVVSGRLEKITVSGDAMTSRQVLLEDWCQQFPSHSIGSLAFGPEGALYVSAGDGANFIVEDHGQFGGSAGSPTPLNPCGDPANEGGALRSQDARTSGDATGLDGAILRLDPDTGAAWGSNANAGDADPNIARIIGYGLRNPFRITVRPDGVVWIGDVGWNTWEEIDKIADPDAAPRDFGWPCYEGNSTQQTYQNANLPICNALASQTGPVYTYSHNADVVPNEGCLHGSSSISGLAFRGTAGLYPDSYDNGLFFTDYTRRCIWFAPSDGGDPDFGNIQLFANLRQPDPADNGGSVYLGTTPAGDLIYTDYDRGEVRTVIYDQPPVAAFTTTPSSGNAPLLVTLDAAGSSDPNGDALSYSWDLDGNGTFGDSAAKKLTHSYSTKGSYDVGLRVTAGGRTDTVHHTVFVGQTAPVPHIDTPLASLTWAVGDDIGFSGHATDAQDGDLPDSAFLWTVKIEHCPSNCHEHTIETFSGVSSGSFSAPDHDYPSHLRLYLKVTDSDGLSATKSVDIYPRTGTVDGVSDPYGIPLDLGAGIGIVGSSIDVSAPASAVLGEDTYAFDHWSDGGDRGHAVGITDGATHLTANYAVSSSADAPNTCNGPVTTTSSAWRPGRFTSGSDVDWYRFSMTSTGTAQIYLADLPGDASLKLYKGCSTLLATADRSGSHPEEIVKVLTKGTYAVKVTSKGATGDDPYLVRIRRLASGVSVMSASAITDDDAGTLRLVGEVWNAYSTTRGPITVTATLYDNDGHLLATRSAPAILYAASHTRAPFVITGSLPDGLARVRYSVTAPRATKTIRSVLIHTTAFARVDARWQAKGTLKATHGSVKTMKLAMTLYDGHGSVVDVVRASIPSMVLSTGRTTTFLAWSPRADLSIDSVRLRAFGFRP